MPSITNEARNWLDRDENWQKSNDGHQAALVLIPRMIAAIKHLRMVDGHSLLNAADLIDRLRSEVTTLTGRLEVATRELTDTRRILDGDETNAVPTLALLAEHRMTALARVTAEARQAAFANACEETQR